MKPESSAARRIAFPVERRTVIAFTIGVVFFACTGYGFATFSDHSPADRWVLYLGLTTAWIATFGVALKRAYGSSPAGQFTRWLIEIGVIFGVTSAMALSGLAAAAATDGSNRGFVLPLPAWPQFWFWCGLILWTSVAVISVGTVAPARERFLAYFGSVWTMSGVLVTVGTLPWLPYSRQALFEMATLGLFVDLRLGTTILFAASLLMTAGYRAFSVLFERPPRLQYRLVPDIQNGAPVLVRVPLGVFIRLANVTLFALTTFADYLWAGLYILMSYLGQVGKELVSLELWRSAVVPRSVLRIILTFVAMIAATLAIIFAAQAVGSYARQHDYLLATMQLLIAVLPLATAVFLLTLLIFLGIVPVMTRATNTTSEAVFAWSRDHLDEATEHTFAGASALIAMAFVASVVLHVVGLVPMIAPPGFDPRRPGVFPVAILGLVLCGWILWRGPSRQPSQDP